MEGLEKLITGQVITRKKPRRRMAPPNLKLVAKKDASVDPMVILVHMLSRYVTEVKGKSNYAASLFLENIRARVRLINRSGKSSTNLPQFYALLSVLSRSYKSILDDISRSAKIRQKERKVVARIKAFSGAEEEMQIILKMLQEVKKDERYRKEINNLISHMKMTTPISSRINSRFSGCLDKLRADNQKLSHIISYVLEKAAQSDRMTKLSATILLAADNEKYSETLADVASQFRDFPDYDAVFARTFAAIFAAKDLDEKPGRYFKRISEPLYANFEAKAFIGFFKQLPVNKLKPNKSPLFVIFRMLVDNSPDFLFKLSHHIFLEAQKNSLSNVPLELMHRGLTAVFDYTSSQAKLYVEKLIESIKYYRQNHLSDKDRHRSHFFLLIASLSKYCQSLLNEIIQRKVFRENESDTLMPVVIAIKNFATVKDRSEALEKIWNMLQPIHQKKETRDELTRIYQLTTERSPAYSKEFARYVMDLLDDEERFASVSEYLLEQFKLDPEKNEAAVRWHVDLIAYIVKYLSDSAITVKAEYRKLLGFLTSRWLAFDSMFMYELFHAVRAINSASLRDLAEYLYFYTPLFLIELIEYFIELTTEEVKEEAAVCAQLVHMSLLERSHAPGMSPNETAERIENVLNLFAEIAAGLEENYKPRLNEVFSLSYMQSIQHLTQVADSAGLEFDTLDSQTVTNIPGSIVSLINQSAKTFNIQNFAERALINLSEIITWAMKIAEKEISRSLEPLEKVSELYRHFSKNYKFPRHTNASITHNFAYKNEFDYFSFAALAYIIGKKMEWEDLFFRNTWRDVTVTISTGSSDLELKNNSLISSASLMKTRERYYNDIKRVMKPMKSDTAIEMFFHIKNGTALCDNRRYRQASISFDKAIEINNTNFFAHYWKAFALKKARINFEQYERHIEIAKRYYPNSNEIEDLMNVQY